MNRVCRPFRRRPTIGVVIRSLPLTIALLVVTMAPPVQAEPATAGRLIDRVVAVIAATDARGHRILITLSDLELEARIGLIARGAAMAADAPLPPDTLGATLEWLIAEHLVLSEAEQLAVAVVEPAELAEALDSFREQLGEAAYERFLQRHEVTEGEILRVLRRRVAVDRYLASRLRLGAVVSDAEVRAAFNTRKAEFGDRDFPEVRDALRAQLELHRREEVVGTLVQDLRSRAQVRVLQAFGERSGGSQQTPREAP